MNTRRSFLKSGALATAGLAAPAVLHGKPGRTLKVGVMGLSRGMAHISGLLQVPDVQVVAVCDVDERRLASGAKHAAGKQDVKIRMVHDFREMLDDKDIDAITIAAPNFWHTPATILACDAGKHVYVEKPGSHNAREAELIVAAARRTKRMVQMGNQRRSLPSFREGIEKLREGVIGKLRYARCWYDNRRGSIGKGQPVAVPEWLNYDLWQGPAPERPYKNNLVHYNWHWHWHYGGGELGNNGVHALDIARWALAVDHPERTACVGGRYHYDDDQETPDTADATYSFGKVGISWHGSSCLPRKHEKNAFVSVYGDGGVLAFESNGYRIFDMEGKKLEENLPQFSDVHHFENFAAGIRDGAALNAEIGDAQKSALLCHLGNIAYRTGTEVRTHPETGAHRGGKVIQEHWGRSYREGWKPAGA